MAKALEIQKNLEEALQVLNKGYGVSDITERQSFLNAIEKIRKKIDFNKYLEAQRIITD